MTTLAPASSVVTVSCTVEPGRAGMPGISTPVVASESVLPELAGTATVAGVGAPAHGEGDVDGRGAAVDRLADDETGLALGRDDDGEVAQVEPHDGEAHAVGGLVVVVGLHR